MIVFLSEIKHIDVERNKGDFSILKFTTEKLQELTLLKEPMQRLNYKRGQRLMTKIIHKILIAII